MPRYRITISGHDRRAMGDLFRKHKINIFDHGISHDDDSGYAVEALAEPPDIEKLEALGYSVQTHEDVDVVGRERQQEVGRGNRYLPPPQSKY